MLFIQVKNVRKLAMGNKPITACKQYCLAAGATQDNIAYTQTVIGNAVTDDLDLSKHFVNIFAVESNGYYSQMSN